jgi:hypothetical protein
MADPVSHTWWRLRQGSSIRFVVNEIGTWTSAPQGTWESVSALAIGASAIAAPILHIRGIRQGWIDASGIGTVLPSRSVQAGFKNKWLLAMATVMCWHTIIEGSHIRRISQ